MMEEITNGLSALAEAAGLHSNANNKPGHIFINGNLEEKFTAEQIGVAANCDVMEIVEEVEAEESVKPNDTLMELDDSMQSICSKSTIDNEIREKAEVIENFGYCDETSNCDSVISTKQQEIRQTSNALLSSCDVSEDADSNLQRSDVYDDVQSNPSNDSSNEDNDDLTYEINYKKLPYEDEELNYAYRLLQELMDPLHDDISWPFLEEVSSNVEGLWDYDEIITNPMWLAKVEEKLLNHEFKTVTDVIAGIRLIFENCYVYHGPNHSMTKKALKLESLLESKLSHWPLNISKKCTLEVTSGKALEDVSQFIARRKTRNKDAFFSHILHRVRHEKTKRMKEYKKKLSDERKLQREEKEKSVIDWEVNELLGNSRDVYMKAMWELPQLGHFLYLLSTKLQFEPLPQYELERMFLMPQASSGFCTLMTSLFRFGNRKDFDSKPPMPYSIWTKKLSLKVKEWYRVFNKEGKKTFKAFESLGIEEPFWSIVGTQNPFETNKFHELSYQQKVWLIKSLCDYMLHKQKTVQDAVNDQPLPMLREQFLGKDRSGNSYLYFPIFLNTDLRIYRQAQWTPPSVEVPNIVDIPVLKTPSKCHKKRKNIIKKKSGKETVPDQSSVRQRPERLRQRIAPANRYSDMFDSDDSGSKEEDSDSENVRMTRLPAWYNQNQVSAPHTPVKNIPISPVTTPRKRGRPPKAKKKLGEKVLSGSSSKMIKDQVHNIKCHSVKKEAQLNEKEYDLCTSEDVVKSILEDILIEVEKNVSCVHEDEKPLHVNDVPANNFLFYSCQPDLNTFELVVDSIESLRNLIESLNTNNQDAENFSPFLGCEREHKLLVKALNQLLEELEPFEARLLASTRKLRNYLLKEWTTWKNRDPNLPEPGEEAWISDPEPEMEIDPPKPVNIFEEEAEYSLSEGNLSDEPGTLLSRRKYHRRRVKRKKTIIDSDDEIEKDAKKSTSDNWEIEVSTRGRTRKVRRFSEWQSDEEMEMEMGPVPKQHKVYFGIDVRSAPVVARKISMTGEKTISLPSLTSCIASKLKTSPSVVPKDDESLTVEVNRQRLLTYSYRNNKSLNSHSSTSGGYTSLFSKFKYEQANVNAVQSSATEASDKSNDNLTAITTSSATLISPKSIVFSRSGNQITSGLQTQSLPANSPLTNAIKDVLKRIPNTKSQSVIVMPGVDSKGKTVLMRLSTNPSLSHLKTSSVSSNNTISSVKTISKNNDSWQTLNIRASSLDSPESTPIINRPKEEAKSTVLLSSVPVFSTSSIVNTQSTPLNSNAGILSTSSNITLANLNTSAINYASSPVQIIVSKNSNLMPVSNVQFLSTSKISDQNVSSNVLQASQTNQTLCSLKSEGIKDKNYTASQLGDLSQACNVDILQAALDSAQISNGTQSSKSTHSNVLVANISPSVSNIAPNVVKVIPNINTVVTNQTFAPTVLVNQAGPVSSSAILVANSAQTAPQLTLIPSQPTQVLANQPPGKLVMVKSADGSQKLGVLKSDNSVDFLSNQDLERFGLTGTSSLVQLQTL